MHHIIQMCFKWYFKNLFETYVKVLSMNSLLYCCLIQLNLFQSTTSFPFFFLSWSHQRKNYHSQHQYLWQNHPLIQMYYWYINLFSDHHIQQSISFLLENQPHRNFILPFFCSLSNYFDCLWCSIECLQYHVFHSAFWNFIFY